MRVQAAALDDCWPNYKSPNLRDGQNPRTREWEVGNLKAHGGQILDRDRAVLLRFEIKGDLRCRRRLVFKPELLAALGAEPLVLLQYQRWPMCPRVYRLELLLVVEAIEAAEAAAAAAEAAAAAAAGAGGGGEPAEGAPAGGDAAGAGGDAAEGAPAGGDGVE